MDSSSTFAEQNEVSEICVGALVPLSRPGWVEAGRHLLAGMECAANRINSSGGILGRPLKLVIRDTAANPDMAIAAVNELAQLGVSAIVGEYHSVVARAVATRADTIGLPFLCCSAVLDSLADKPTKWVARIAPPQSVGWKIYADFLLREGHTTIAVASIPSIYWTSGISILRDYYDSRGGSVIEFNVPTIEFANMCNDLVNSGATALLLLVGMPEPAYSIIKTIRQDKRLDGLMFGAPAGQPEFSEWMKLLGNDGAKIPFLRYLPEAFTPLGIEVQSTLNETLDQMPSFVAFEGFDAVTFLAEVISAYGADRAAIADSWSRIEISGTRGQMKFSRLPNTNIWQWNEAPIQVVDRDPENHNSFRILRLSSERIKPK